MAFKQVFIPKKRNPILPLTAPPPRNENSSQKKIQIREVHVDYVNGRSKRLKMKDLPDEIIASILEYTPPKTILKKICLISKRLYNICNSDYLWKFYAHKVYKNVGKKVKYIRKKIPLPKVKVWKKIYYLLKRSEFKFHTSKCRYRNKVLFSKTKKIVKNMEFGNVTIPFNQSLYPRGCHVIKFAFKRKKRTRHFQGMLVGLCDLSRWDIEDFELWLGSNKRSWGFYLDSGTIRHDSKSRLIYHSQLKENDIISMLVDFGDPEKDKDKEMIQENVMRHAKVSFKINDKDLGVGFEKVFGNALVPAVTMEFKGQRFQILNT